MKTCQVLHASIMAGRLLREIDPAGTVLGK